LLHSDLGAGNSLTMPVIDGRISAAGLPRPSRWRCGRRAAQGSRRERGCNKRGTGALSPP
jgi:hypothetical protein